MGRRRREQATGKTLKQRIKDAEHQGVLKKGQEALREAEFWKWFLKPREIGDRK